MDLLDFMFPKPIRASALSFQFEISIGFSAERCLHTRSFRAVRSLTPNV
ncbi:RNA binding protein [Zea mays]|uniref:RNA binding protein n=1 Tax=Zea mays TaxID=4577 RepID=A0A1D6L7N3_MAIZE|nr:RNA binding protein [Zea mays]